MDTHRGPGDVNHEVASRLHLDSEWRVAHYFDWRGADPALEAER
jgi:hypothetical protein